MNLRYICWNSNEKELESIFTKLFTDLFNEISSNLFIRFTRCIIYLILLINSIVWIGRGANSFGGSAGGGGGPPGDQGGGMPNNIPAVDPNSRKRKRDNYESSDLNGWELKRQEPYKKWKRLN